MVKPASASLILILCAALTIRITWATLAPISLDQLPDQREYLTLGQNLLHQGSLNFFDPRFNQTVWVYRMPGYPLFVAACGGSIPIIRIAQCLLDVSTLWAVFLITRRLTSNTVAANIAAGLMAVNPFFIYFSSKILTETLFASLLAWLFWSLLLNRWMLVLLINVILCYVRPSGLLLAPFLIVVASLNQTQRTTYPVLATLHRLTSAALILSVCLWPWASRNHRLLGSYIWTTTNSGVTAFDGFHTGANGGSDQRFIADFPQLSSMNEVGRSRFFTREAMKWAEQNFARLPALTAKKIARSWSPVPLSKEFGKPIYRFASAMYAVPFDLLCLIGLLSSLLKPGVKMLLITPAFYFTLVQVMSVGSIRYRMPAESILAVLASVGAAHLLKLKHEEQPK